MADESASPSVNDLIVLAKEALNLSDEPLLVQLGAFEEYSSRFREVEDSEQLGQGDEQELKELHELHAQVLERATELQGRLAGEMASLQTRGKAVMQYLDQVPRRISAFRSRKG